MNISNVLYFQLLIVLYFVGRRPAVKWTHPKYFWYYVIMYHRIQIELNPLQCQRGTLCSRATSLCLLFIKLTIIMFLLVMFCTYILFQMFQIHINLMIMEARMQSELLFVLRAVMNYMLWYAVTIYVYIIYNFYNMLYIFFCYNLSTCIQFWLYDLYLKGNHDLFSYFTLLNFCISLI